MLIKLETKSARVKGISFHPKRPWLLASLHNGQIQMWDYRMSTQLEKYDEHEGPVRGICFHMQQPLFVSGGDDYKIKVWNYKLRKCLFTLLGHLDYIRTTFFHHEYPWILSSSDDQTIRVWNWQSRNCISIITGHNHYVMCAQFHPTEDLIASASLDQTIRVWDISGLRKKNAMPGPEGMQMKGNNSTELFSTGEVVVKHVLEGHDRGVNWVAFHPTLPLLCSGADDRQVKLWRMNDTKAWEVDTCRGHYNNVSCVAFHPRKDFILSDSEDKTIRVWDMTKRTVVQSFRKESERFWTLTYHPHIDIFAAGHDTGLMVFKLERERPAYACSPSTLFYVKDNTLVRALDFNSITDIPLFQLRNMTTNSGLAANASTTLRVYSLSYNPAENAFLICRRGPEANYFYELCALGAGYVFNEGSATPPETKRGTGINAIWVARNRFAVLEKNHMLVVKNLQNEVVKKIQITSSCEDIFQAKSGCILTKEPDNVTLYDVQQKRVLASAKVSKVKYIIWSADYTLLALMSKHTLTICSQKLVILYSIHENIRIKSGSFNENGVFIYNTSNHIKYILPNGDYGIIRTLDTHIYIVRVAGNNLYCLDRSAKPLVLTIDPTEFTFKLALINRQYENVLHMIQNTKLIGQSIISYLRQKGYPEVALYFVKDEKTRFILALECGNLNIALESARKLDNAFFWKKLGELALAQGDQKILEMCYQRAKKFEKLTFFYLVTGNTDKVKRMMKIAEMRNDQCNQYRCAMFLNDYIEQFNMLVSKGQYTLAYMLASKHGLNEQIESIREHLDADSIAKLPTKTNNLMQSCVPVYKNEESWPLLFNIKSVFETMLHTKKKTAHTSPELLAAASMLHDEDIGEAWDEHDENDLDVEGGQLGRKGAKNGTPMGATELEEGGDWDVDGDDLSIPIDISKPGISDTSISHQFPITGLSQAKIWGTSSSQFIDMIMSGEFDNAFNTLNLSIGAVNFNPFKKIILECYSRQKVFVPTLFDLPPFKAFPQRKALDAGVKGSLPLLNIDTATLIKDLQSAYQLTTAGKFSDAIDKFKGILATIPLLVVETKQEIAEVNGLVSTCREYIVGLKMEQFRKGLPKESSEDHKRNAELAAYFTHCDLQPIHLILTLRTALSQFYKLKNYKTASNFARKLLELGPKPEIATQVRNILKVCEKDPSDETLVYYDHNNPFSICAQSYVPIYRGKDHVNCLYCKASFLPEYKDYLCNVCEISTIDKIKN